MARRPPRGKGAPPHWISPNDEKHKNIDNHLQVLRLCDAAIRLKQTTNCDDRALLVHEWN
jgi:hypothetical protein